MNDKLIDCMLFFYSPNNEVVFNLSDSKADIIQYINLHNTSNQTLGYKVGFKIKI